MMAAKGQHEQMETAAPRPSSKLDGVNNPAAQHWVEKLLTILQEITDRWKEAAATQQTSANKMMQSKEYTVGDSVWLSAKTIHTRRLSRKLDLKYYGRFPITERIGKLAYKLRLGDSVGYIYPVFHVSLLEHCPPPTQVNAEEPEAQQEVKNEEQGYTVKEIRYSRICSLELQYLLK